MYAVKTLNVFHGRPTDSVRVGKLHKTIESAERYLRRYPLGIIVDLNTGKIERYGAEGPVKCLGIS